MTEKEFSQLIPFESIVIMDNSCDDEVQFTAMDIANCEGYHRGVYFYTDKNAKVGLWKYQEGCFNGYGETLKQAISDLDKIRQKLPEQERDSLCSFRAFMAPCYD